MSTLRPETLETERILHLREGFLLERIDGEISVYHPTLTTAIYLNETGALIWELCDGNRSVGDIIDLLGHHNPERYPRADPPGVETKSQTTRAQSQQRGDCLPRGGGAPEQDGCHHGSRRYP